MKKVKLKKENVDNLTESEKHYPLLKSCVLRQIFMFIDKDPDLQKQKVKVTKRPKRSKVI